MPTAAFKLTWPCPALPDLVEMITTPLAAREPYREAAAASFSTVMDSMSCGLMLERMLVVVLASLAFLE